MSVTDPLSESRVYQVSYVTADLTMGMEVLRNVRGVTLRDLGETDLHVDGQDPARIRIAMGFLGEVMFEMIQPLAGTVDVYTCLLPGPGRVLGFHHLAFKMLSIDHLGVQRARLVEQGHQIALEGGRPDRARFLYADFRRELGHFVEYLYLSPERERFHNSLPRSR